MTGGDAAARPSDCASKPAAIVPMDGAAGRRFASPWRLPDAVVDRRIGQVEPDYAVVGGLHQVEQRVHYAGGDPRISSTTGQGGGRHRRMGDAVVGAGEDQHLDQFVEDEGVRDARAVAAEPMVDLVGRQQDDELGSDRLDDG